jgi:CubicO group peptidase (beta-lactamase class C family)
VAKSITSTLVGAAMRDGHIKSMDDKVSDYIPQMKGSAYDDVSIRQLLTMTSGVRWNEDYATPTPTWRVQQPQARGRRGRAGELPAPAAARGARRHALACTAPARPTWWASWSARPRKPLATYLSEKIWVPAGMEQQATWILSKTRAGDQRLLHPGRDRATLRASGSSS